MSAATFDTHAAVKTLREAGADRDELATKVELRAELAALEARLTWRLVGIAAAIVAAPSPPVVWPPRIPALS